MTPQRCFQDVSEHAQAVVLCLKRVWSISLRQALTTHITGFVFINNNNQVFSVHYPLLL